MIGLCCFLLLIFDSGSGALPFALAGYCCLVEARGAPNAWWERRNSCPKELQAEWLWDWLSSFLSFKGCVYWLEQAAPICSGIFLFFFQKWLRFFCLLRRLHISWYHLRSVFTCVRCSMGSRPAWECYVCGGRGKGSWSDCLGKLMVISAIFCKFQGIVS